MKKDIEENIIIQIRSQILGRLKEYPVRLKFDWIEENLKRDLDNIASAKKYILDAMVKCGLLDDDNRKCVSGFEDSFPFIDKQARVEITIEY